MAMGSFGIVMLISAMIGMSLLNNLYGNGVRNSVVVESLIEQTEEEETVADKEYNNRLPLILESNELTTKIFSNGWKFDLFNNGTNT